MKRCIKCNRTNDKKNSLLVLFAVGSAECEDCVNGVEVERRVNKGHGRKKKVVDEVEWCKCGVVLNDGNRYVYGSGRKENRCIECARKMARERYVSVRDRINVINVQIIR